MLTSKHQVALDAANKIIEQKKEHVAQSTYRLHYHFMAPTGWINDPNGFVQYSGEYHLFYQHYPYDSKWGPMHWGHAKSDDLIHWKHLPVALAPSEPYDSGDVEGYGCFSGSAFVNNGELVLAYTGHVDGNTPQQVQCIATSKDGVHFEKYEHNPVIDQFPSEGTHDFRDPKVWKHEDKWYMVVGTKKDGKGKAALYTSEDQHKWEFKGIAAESDGTQGDMWECPDLFPLNHRHVLIVSPMYGKQNENPFYVIGDMDYEAGIFTQKVSSILDYGFDFYAPQTLVDDKGRRIVIGWMEKWLTKMPSQEHGWAGAMSIPRELVLESNHVVKQKPIEEIVSLRSDYQKWDVSAIDGVKVISETYDSVSETIIEVDVNETDAAAFGLQLRCSQDGEERTDILFDLKNNEIKMDRTRSGSGEKGVSTAPLHIKDGSIHIRLFMDTTSVELFVNEGEQVITNRFFPNEKSQQFNIFTSDGHLKIRNFESWKLNSSWK
ncbi:sucrose-6-phosphate hydrolase [Paenibacillus chitinolyticus]|uniref:Sucrose-6-phosphate hydrolase n=1 Tax=Paenibacillus chitinolyticus TaxID=79263 RepID=A0A410WUV0_9BACL|nr:glycoside hydrolase family 32 protein [Paenibacillus chitinolyticus]MCY9594073.1 glycoside hydrolase family 32 protein [Paenibacillus chitinolyticus]MCY9596158.1 glycoside hydrolase family 32 protein [Paenibacillus chitinolyticus]QAV18110.1 sucrose-6-phosphate hydrolase [Paenibacillus chitinolyticus]